MIKSSLLLLACLSITTADSMDDSIEPTCERELPDEIHFNLSRTGLTILKKNFMVSDKVSCMYFADNNISKLEIGAFDGLPNLRYLNLAGNPLAFGIFARMKFSSLRSLVYDGPSDNDGNSSAKSYTEMDEDDVRHNYHNHGNQLKNRLFTDFPVRLPNLQKVSFNNYQESSVLKRLDYMDAPNLTYLSIASNGIGEIRLPQGITERLTHLNADNNRIEMYTLTAPNLRYLSMNGNKIHKLCMMHCNWNAIAIGTIPMLEHLSLAYNDLTLIEDNTFDNSTELKYLNLTGNELTSLPQNLSNVVTLRTLVLSDNNLTIVPDIRGLVELEVLHLADNDIDAIDGEVFSNLTKLRSIDLHGNLLKSLPNGTFAHLPALAKLDLSRNRLTQLAANWIGAAEKLVSLKLHRNSFRDVANMSLGSFKKLVKLTINDNPLKALTARTFAALPPNTQIKLQGRL